MLQNFQLPATGVDFKFVLWYYSLKNLISVESVIVSSLGIVESSGVGDGECRVCENPLPPILYVWSVHLQLVHRIIS